MESTAFRADPLNRRYGRLLSCSVPCKGIRFQDFLGAAAGQPRSYWENRNNRLAFAGAGKAVELMAWGEERFRKIARDARDLFARAHIVGDHPPWTGPRLYGGFSFRGDFTPDNTWSIYAPAHFVLPHYQLVRIDGETWLTINTQIPPEEDPVALVSDLQAVLREKIRQLQVEARRLSSNRQSPLQSVRYPMSFDMWEAMICQATERIHAGELNKVVLARAAELRFEARPRLMPILSHLAENYADCYRFLFEPRPRFAFYGASPELLASVRGKRIETVGLAGSIGRGINSEDDMRLGRELLHSHKNRQEQSIVVDRIRDRLLPLTETLEIAPPSLLKLKNIQHLQSPIQGRLKQESGILALLETLHPTPALGGDPRERAMRLIRDLEPIPRGWYGAPVGWIDANLDGQFTVAIRSAVAQEYRVWIYAGAGIVRDSQPESEWEETALKFRPMLEAHGSSTQRHNN
ncbi:MAG: isochorismate synthase [Chloroflexi bacterium]|nr:isochorismate synthase [Chloroflexota bacterium]